MKKVFIVGVGRSGTSLLQSMLNAHSKISFMPETHFLRKYVFKSSVIVNSKNIDYIIETLNNDDDYLRAKIPAIEIVKIGMQYVDIYDALLDVYLKRKGKEIIGDKDPRNIDFLPRLNALYPEGKVIHMIRDPRDVVLSRTKADWSKGRPFYLHAYMYITQMKRGRRHGKERYGSNYTEIFYEDLIGDPVKVLNELCTFLDVNFEENMLDFSKSAIELVDKSEMQWKKETFGPLLVGNKNKWKEELNEQQIGLIQCVCEPVFNKDMYSYYNDAKISIISKVVHKTAAMFFKILYPIRINYLRK